MMDLITTYLKGKKQQQFLREMQAKNVTTILDVRWTATWPMYFNPHAQFQNIGAAANVRGIRYEYCKKLGNPTHLRQQFPVVSDWQGAQRAYLRYVETDFQAKVALYHYAREVAFQEGVLCVVCFCPTTDGKTCHRFWLAEQLQQLAQTGDL